jgi:hypothetical protein
MIGGIKCQNCGKEIPEDETFATEGKTSVRTAISIWGIGSGYATPGESSPRGSSGKVMDWKGPMG